MAREQEPDEPFLSVAETRGSLANSHKVRSIFVGQHGIRAGWRFALFLAILAVLRTVVVHGLRLIPPFLKIAKATQTSGVLSPQFQLIFQSATVLVVLLTVGVMGKIEKRSFSAYGLPRRGMFGRLFWRGVVWGLAFETLTILAIWAFGGFSFGTLALAGGAIIKYAISWAVGFLLVGVFEELLFRGYSQFTLASGMGFWPSAVLLSAVFGAAHLGNSGEGWIGALSLFIFGMFGCLTLKRTGNLWFIIGFHASMDYAETFLYSTADSGFLAEGHLLHSSFHGSRWLTGGSIGPEGSLMELVVFFAAFILFDRLYPAQEIPIS